TGAGPGSTGEVPPVRAGELRSLWTHRLRGDKFDGLAEQGARLGKFPGAFLEPLAELIELGAGFARAAKSMERHGAKNETDLRGTSPEGKRFGAFERRQGVRKAADAIRGGAQDGQTPAIGSRTELRTLLGPAQRPLVIPGVPPGTPHEVPARPHEPPGLRLVGQSLGDPHRGGAGRFVEAGISSELLEQLAL